MKLFHDLTETQRENTLHHLMHIIFENWLDNFILPEPEDDDGKQLWAETQKALETARALEEFGAQMDVLFENENACELAWQTAYDTAHTSYFTEEGENCFHLPSIAEMFESNEEESGAEVVEAGTDNVIPFPGKKPSELN